MDQCVPILEEFMWPFMIIMNLFPLMPLFWLRPRKNLRIVVPSWSLLFMFCLLSILPIGTKFLGHIRVPNMTMTSIILWIHPKLATKASTQYTSSLCLSPYVLFTIFPRFVKLSSWAVKCVFIGYHLSHKV